MLDKIKSWAKALKRDVFALWIASRDTRIPWHAKVAAAALAAYTLSPIDLIPDFIPVLGYLDDLVIVPLAIWLVVKLIPAPLMMEFRSRALQQEERPSSIAGLVVIVAVWLLALILFIWWVVSVIGR